jgi:hypothetical protein
VTGAFVALAVAAVGTVVSFIGSFFAAAAGAPEVIPWAQVGGTATAVGALAYVAKLLADGRLVAQPVADLIRDAKVREDALTAIAKVMQEDRTKLMELLVQRGATT